MSKKANPAELAIIKMSLAEKRLSVLPILFEEATYTDIVDEAAGIVGNAVASLVFQSGTLLDEQQELIEQFEGCGETLGELPREHLTRIVQIHDEIADWKRKDEAPSRAEAEKLIEWCNFLVDITLRTVKDLERE